MIIISQASGVCGPFTNRRAKVLPLFNWRELLIEYQLKYLTSNWTYKCFTLQAESKTIKKTWEFFSSYCNPFITSITTFLSNKLYYTSSICTSNEKLYTSPKCLIFHKKQFSFKNISSQALFFVNCVRKKNLDSVIQPPVYWSFILRFYL